MLAKNRFALKEWAVVETALSQGRQILLLRHGGLIEQKGQFRIEHREFFIYPTYLHQQRKGIVPGWTAELEQILAAPPPEETVVISHYGVVHDAVRISDPDQLPGISGFHILNEEEIFGRFNRIPPGLHLIIIRLFRLSEPHRLPVRPHYAGCRSWVDFGVELPTAGCRPVLDDPAFQFEIQRISAVMAQREVPIEPPGTA
jgi:hypothetical protein